MTLQVTQCDKHLAELLEFLKGLKDLPPKTLTEMSQPDARDASASKIYNDHVEDPAFKAKLNQLSKNDVSQVSAIRGALHQHYEATKPANQSAVGTTVLASSMRELAGAR